MRGFKTGGCGESLGVERRSLSGSCHSKQLPRFGFRSIGLQALTLGLASTPLEARLESGKSFVESPLTTAL